jgi:protein-S-isoprenylcysteine O-methyltransferase Ste14
VTKHKEQGDRNRDTERNVHRRFMQVIMQIVLFAVLLFVSADGLHWPWAWIYLGIYVAGVIANAFILPRTVIEERGKSKENVKEWDKVITTLSIFPGLGLFVVAGLDYRFGWSTKVSIWIQLASLVLMILGYALFVWAMVSNPFFSTAVRIQFDRDHKTAAEGPYQHVRHPGYLGFIASNLATALVLGSLWALIPGAITAGLLIVRTALEDSTLHKELDGYKEYAEKVKYRLIPRIW